jgi:serine/threonine-protein kinase
VLDFGIAQGVFEIAPAEEKGRIFGTVYYMPPEQALGHLVDARADVYAAGAVLFEMLMGFPPFAGDTPEQILSRMLTLPAPRLRSHRPEIPEVVDNLVASALSKNPSHRPQSIRAFIDALLAHSTKLPASVTRTAPQYEAVRIVQNYARPAVKPRLELVLDSLIPPRRP